MRHHEAHHEQIIVKVGLVLREYISNFAAKRANLRLILLKQLVNILSHAALKIVSMCHHVPFLVLLPSHCSRWINSVFEKSEEKSFYYCHQPYMHTLAAHLEEALVYTP